MGRLNDCVAVVTHGTSGIGAGISERLRTEGAVVVATDALPATRDAALRVAASAVERHGRIDILVNGADEQTDFVPLALKREAVGSSAQSVLWMMQAVYPTMKAQATGRIVNLVSVFGDSLNRQLADTVAASEAVKSLTRSAAEEWGQFGILVNALAPAADTATFQAMRESASDAVDAMVAGSPMGRMGDPVEDIGGAVMLLVGESGRFLTGHVLYADGGQHLTPTPFEAVVPID